MSDKKYREAPEATTGVPAGIPYIVGNEAAERFSYYGMKTILVMFMMKHMLNSDGAVEHLSEADATSWYHTFGTAVYFLPILGAILSDTVLGKYKTILSLSIVYCLGHLALAIDDTRIGLITGLTLIAIGSGGIKPCVSAHVGDQFGLANKHHLEKIFQWFYFSINFGSAFSTLLTPWLLANCGPHWAFGVPGGLMLLATWTFWLGRNKFVHIPPAGTGFLKEVFNKEGLSAIARLSIIYIFIAVFWSLYEQTGSRWVIQADHMDKVIQMPWASDSGSIDSTPTSVTLNPLTWIPQEIELLPSQIQAVNPFLVMIFIPLFAKVAYPQISRVFPLTPLRKIGIGFFLTAASFAVVSITQQWIDQGLTPHIGWQVLAYVILTAGEVMVYLTGLEFSYTQSPNTMKSFVMAMYLLTVSLGNVITASVNEIIQKEDGTDLLEGADYYWFFTGLMLMTTVIFIFVSRFYKEKTYIQQESPAAH